MSARIAISDAGLQCCYTADVMKLKCRIAVTYSIYDDDDTYK